MDYQFGTSRGLPQLNDAILEYDEIRAGAGLTWKVYKSVYLDLKEVALLTGASIIRTSRTDSKSSLKSWFPIYVLDCQHCFDLTSDSGVSISKGVRRERSLLEFHG